MIDCTKMWSVELPRLVAPFALSQFIYWQLLYYPNTEPSIPTLIVKCLPVSTLALYIWSHEKRGEVWTILRRKYLKGHCTH